MRLFLPRHAGNGIQGLDETLIGHDSNVRPKIRRELPPINLLETVQIRAGQQQLTRFAQCKDLVAVGDPRDGSRLAICLGWQGRAFASEAPKADASRVWRKG